MLRIKVSRQMPVFVVWSRGRSRLVLTRKGQKQAKTKSRLLSDSMDIAAFDEKFQISTQLEVDAEGKAIGQKMSKLTIMGDKGAVTLGEAALDMAQFSEDAPVVRRLKLDNCDDAESFLEIGLKGVEQPSVPDNISGR